MPFGVELPENFGTPPTESPSGASPAGGSDSAPQGESNPPQRTEPQTVDLDSLERVRYQGKELSKQEFDALLMGSQSQPQNESAKFDQNFRFDFKTVMEDPSKLAEFRRIYPPEYVQVVEAALQKAGIQTQAVRNDDKPWKNDPEFVRATEFAQKFEQQQKEMRVQHINNQLDSNFEKLGKKYPEADPNVINWWLQGLDQRGIELMNKDANGTPTTLKTQILEKLFKEDHERREAHYEQKYRAKVEAQKKANNSSRDMGAGGSASSGKPQGFRTIKEATAAALSELSNR